jgi:hypothetical protein
MSFCGYKRFRRLTQIKGNVIPVLTLCHEGIWGSGRIAPPILSSALGGSGQHHAPAALPSGSELPDTHWIGGWVGPRAGLDAMEKKNKSLASTGNQTPAVQPVA